MAKQNSHSMWLSLAGLLILYVHCSASTSLEVISPRRILQVQDTDLLPTFEPALCSGGSCCQQDDYTSEYRLQLSNITKVNLGDNFFTTFHFFLRTTGACSTDLDTKGCCTADADEIYINIDPSLKVIRTAVNNQVYNTLTEQSQFGLHMTNLGLTMAMLSAGPVSMDVTVEGEVSRACPLPENAPIAGLCNVIVIGGSQAECCPRSISQPIPATPDNAVVIIPEPFECEYQLERNGFEMDLASVTDVFSMSGRMFANYTFHLGATSSCDRSNSNTCCSMDLQYILMKITAAVTIHGIYLNDVATPFSTADYNLEGPVLPLFQNLLLDSVNLDMDDAALGATLLVTVAIKAGSTTVPHLCSLNAATSYGACEYVLRSSSGNCCPEGTTSVVDVTPNASPPPMDIACSPFVEVPYSEVGMIFQYNKQATSAESTSFLFSIIDQSTLCPKPHSFCGVLCSWSMYITSATAAKLTALLEDMPASERPSYIITFNGLSPMLTWTYGPAASSIASYSVTLPGGVVLADLCNPSALPNQKDACAVVLRTDLFYTNFFFGESNVLLVQKPVVDGLCSTSQPLRDSCLNLDVAAYNSAPSSTYSFTVTNRSSNGACKDTSAASFALYLTPSSAAELAASAAYIPSTIASIDATSGVVLWTWTPDEDDLTTKYMFNLVSSVLPADACRQGIFQDQAKGTCLVEFKHTTSCFRGLVTPVRDNSLTWVSAPAPSPSSGDDGGISTGGIVAMAILIPLVVIALLVVGVWYMRRRQLWSPRRGLDEPLASEPSNASLHSDGGIAEVDHSAVSVRVRPSGGGAGPPAESLL